MFQMGNMYVLRSPVLTIDLSKKMIRFPSVSRGFLERRIPGKNGEGTPRKVGSRPPRRARGANAAVAAKFHAKRQLRVFVKMDLDAYVSFIWLLAVLLAVRSNGFAYHSFINHAESFEQMWVLF